MKKYNFHVCLECWFPAWVEKDWLKLSPCLHPVVSLYCFCIIIIQTSWNKRKRKWTNEQCASIWMSCSFSETIRLSPSATKYHHQPIKSKWTTLPRLYLLHTIWFTSYANGTLTSIFGDIAILSALFQYTIVDI